MSTERDIKLYLVKRVILLGGQARRLKCIPRGTPELLVTLPRQPPVWVELKTPAARLTPAQLRMHFCMRAEGKTVLVIDSIEAVNQWLGAPPMTEETTKDQAS